MKVTDCTNDGCSAPICPLDKDSLKNGIWYPDEPICTSKDRPDWVTIQKRIAKKAKNKERFFTHKDFLRIKVVRNPRGHNPDPFQNVT